MAKSCNMEQPKAEVRLGVPPPAPLPDPEEISIEEVYHKYLDGEIDLICILGPTASGKTAYAVRVARLVNELAGRPVAEILSADSRQVYRGMDVGSGKDLEEYGEIPYHLIDIQPAGARYNIFEYQRDFVAAYQDILRRGCVPILCGGSGLYIEAATCDYRINPSNPVDPSLMPHKTYYIGTLVDRETRVARIDKRLDDRLEHGLVEEIAGLLEQGVPAENLIFYGLEYKFVTLHVLGELSREEMRRLLAIAIHQFAKRQMTWFRGMERDGVKIHWVKV